MNMLPVIHSRFQPSHKLMARIKTGTLCINKPRAISQKPEAESKTSRENIARNRRNITERIRGVQKIQSFLIVFSFLISS